MRSTHADDTALCQHADEDRDKESADGDEKDIAVAILTMMIVMMMYSQTQTSLREHRSIRKGTALSQATEADPTFTRSEVDIKEPSHATP